jgi:hypothetical protein
MADNSSLPVASGNETFANDDIGGIKYPRPKINWGPDGTANDVDVASGKALPTQLRNSDGTLMTDATGIKISTASQNANGQATMANSTPVVMASDHSVIQTSPQPLATGGLSAIYFLDIDESPTSQQVKATAGCLYKLRITNRATTVRYVRLYNAVPASVTVGTTTPIDTIVVPAASSTDLPTVLTESFGGIGLTFSTALTVAATTGFADNDTGAPGTNDVIVSAYYK